MVQDNRSPVSWLGRHRPERWGALGLVTVTLAGCGATSRHQPGDPEPDGNRAGASQGGSGNPGAGGGQAAAGGSSAETIALTGVPKYYRFVRLTNSQWARSVQEVLRLAEPSGLERDFSAPVVGVTDFSNNELVLDVNGRTWQELQTAAEALATQVTASDEALAALYDGTDSAGFIQAVGRRAYRRPLTNAEVSKCTALFAAGAAMPGSQSAFAKGAALVIRALLQSPHFLYRTELGATGEALSGYEVTAKLSLLLRGSAPNDALLDEAETLGEPDALADAATVMLRNAAATSVMRQFHGELLHFDRFQHLSKVNTPGYDPSLNAELQESSYMFFDNVFAQGLGVRDILTSTRGFVGKAMAPLYGLEPAGSGLVERELGASRVGYFAQLPFLTLYAQNEQPDAIHRGLSLAVDMLCAPLGGALGQVPPLPELEPGQTGRQRIEEMTGSCGASCHHQIINPLGFAFEHFDGMGQYRDTEAGGLPIDSSGSYAFTDGRADFADHAELMEAMASRPNAHLCYAKKLASFALQRDLAVSDLPWLKELAELSRDAGGAQQLILQLVKNDAFRSHGGAP